jgi:hypothetical protein
MVLLSDWCGKSMAAPPYVSGIESIASMPAKKQQKNPNWKNFENIFEISGKSSIFLSQFLMMLIIFYNFLNFPGFFLFSRFFSICDNLFFLSQFSMIFLIF